MPTKSYIHVTTKVHTLQALILCQSLTAFAIPGVNTLYMLQEYSHPHSQSIATISVLGVHAKRYDPLGGGTQKRSRKKRGRYMDIRKHCRKKRAM